MFLIILILIFILFIYKEKNFYLNLGFVNVIQSLAYLQILLLKYPYGLDLILIYLSISTFIYLILFFTRDNLVH